MKTVVKVSLALMMTAGTVQAERVKRYEVGSGRVTYGIAGSHEIRAIGLKERIRGEKSIVFDAYGDKEIVESRISTESESDGRSSVEKEREMTLTDGIDQYRVDFDKKRIVKRRNPLYTSNYTLVDGKDIDAFMPKAKRVGTETVAGLECTVWKKKNRSLCIHKGIVLKKHSDGVTVVAVKAEFDTQMEQSDFALPDFPLYDKRGRKIP